MCEYEYQALVERLFGEERPLLILLEPHPATKCFYLKEGKKLKNLPLL